MYGIIFEFKILILEEYLTRYKCLQVVVAVVVVDLFNKRNKAWLEENSGLVIGGLRGPGMPQLFGNAWWLTLSY